MSQNVEKFLARAKQLLAACSELHREFTLLDANSPELAKLDSLLIDFGASFDQAVRAAAVTPPPEVSAQPEIPSTDSSPAHSIDETLGDEADEDDGTPAALKLAQKLTDIADVIESGRFVIESSEYAFSRKAVSLLENMQDEDGNIPAMPAAKLFVDCIRFMDKIEFVYEIPKEVELIKLISKLRVDLAEHLKSLEITLAPDPTSSQSLQEAAMAIADKALTQVNSQKPAGSIVGIQKRGVTTSAGVEQPHFLTSSGATSKAFEMTKRAAGMILRPGDPSSPDREKKAAVFKEIKAKYLPQLETTTDANQETTVIRYVANLLQPLAKGAGPVDDAVKILIATLNEYGIKPVPASLGGTFDESYATSKYERRTVRSNEVPGIVVAVIRQGFLNAEGVPLQKAVIGVSGGPEFHA